jgi:hypothetical protein
MTGFYPGVRPSDLVPGDAESLYGLAGQLSTLAGGFSDAGSELAAIDAGQWQGVAANAFRRAVQQQPAKYTHGATAFQLVARAIQAYAAELENAQTVAANAIDIWEQGQRETSHWEATRSATAMFAPDPGAALRSSAESMLWDGRSGLDAAALAAVSALDSASQSAPRRPSLVDDLVGGAEKVAYFESGLDIHADIQFLEGIGVGTWGMVDGVYDLGRALWDISPERAMLDPKGWAHSMSDLVSTSTALLQNAEEHPATFFETLGSNLINLHEWETDPAKAMGELVPVAVLAIATAGAGAGADAAGKTATTLSDSADTIDELAGTEGAAGGDGSLLDMSSGLRGEAQGSATVQEGLQSFVGVQHALGPLQDAQGVVQALEGQPNHEVDGHVIGSETESITDEALAVPDL